MATTIVPRVATIHYDSDQMQWHLKASDLKETGNGNTFPELRDVLETLADVITALTAFWAVLGPDGAYASKARLGNMKAALLALAATFPDGDIPVHAPLT